MDASLLAKINEARQSRRAIAVATDIGSGEQTLILPDQLPGGELGEDVDRRLRSGKSGTISISGVETFVQVQVPPPRLVVIGAVHISQALVPMAQACGFDVTVIDPRTAFASPVRLPSVELLAEWPADVLKDRPLDPFTALVGLTHDPKIDDLPLQLALRTGCFYIGALGSQKTHAKRAARFAEAGFDEGEMSRIHAPIGLNIGSANPAEIAVSILAEIIQTLRKEPVD
jgi:xanthine dehydrogenase accessory factor